MQPYNEYENRWLSGAKKNLKKHWMEYEPMYAVLSGIIAIVLLVLAVAASVSSFF
jgi:hypothetical protein